MKDQLLKLIELKYSRDKNLLDWLRANDLRGDKGDKPEFGIDYWTEEQVNEVAESIIERIEPRLEAAFNENIPKKGVNYFTEEEISSIVEQVLSEIKVENGKDAEVDYEIIQNFVLDAVKENIPEVTTIVNELTATQVRDKLEDLEGDDRLDISAIKGVDLYVDKDTLDRAISILDQRTQFLINKQGGSGSLSNITGLITAGAGVTITGSGTSGSPYVINSDADLSVTLADVSANSTDTTKSLYTLTSGVPVEFRSSDSNTILYIDETNERVGIGTSSPAQLLDILSTGTSANANIRITSTGTGTNNGYASQQFGNNLGTNRWQFGIGGGNETIYGVADKFYIFNTADNAMRMVIAPTTGYVGIGTTSPNQTLHVNGTTYLGKGTNGWNFSSNTITPQTNGFLTLDNSNSRLFSITNTGASDVYFRVNSSSTNPTSGTVTRVESVPTFNPTSGTAVFNTVNVAPTINQTGGANGITRGLYINPTLTAAADWRSIEVASGKSIFQELLSKKLVEANTAGSGSPNIITAAESGTVFTNEGTTALNYHTLPTAVAGLTYTFYVDDADGIRITANTGDIIQVNGVASTTAGYAECTAIGGSITLTAINATDWVATSYIGTWTLV